MFKLFKPIKLSYHTTSAPIWKIQFSHNTRTPRIHTYLPVIRQSFRICTEHCTSFRAYLARKEGRNSSPLPSAQTDPRRRFAGNAIYISNSLTHDSSQATHHPLLHPFNHFQAHPPICAPLEVCTASSAHFSTHSNLEVPKSLTQPGLRGRRLQFGHRWYWFVFIN